MSTELVDEPSAEVAASRLELLTVALTGPLELGSYTDEELVGLDAADGRPFAPSPWFSALSQQEGQVAVVAALRGLTARGLYRAIPVNEESGEITFEADPDLLALLSLRRQVPTVVVAEHRAQGRAQWHVLYSHPEGLWLGEKITPIGVHEFTLADRDHWVRVLTEWSGATDPVQERPFLDVVVPPVNGSAAEAAPPYVVAVCEKSTVITRFDAADGAPRETWGSVHAGTGAYYVARESPAGMHYLGATARDVRARWDDALEPLRGV
ncbi:hypothetical protein KIH74_07065 [Kineosporia sp. J2-2]|uniref:ESX secretion-associated protein EspG n=1 Tax=Kineosporia corallincola TaxID=2835133 RepID=A0ABS5TC67_9ACTN|nr:hypothetical protein [Kineosporia corallincola]MBT0768680.1 hypothetical protein [Kineosporia corallincola]